MKNHLKEFSKRVIVWLVIAYFIVLLFGLIYYSYWLFKGNVVDITPMFDYTKTIMLGGLLGYLLKAAFENTEKIKKSHRNSSEKDDGMDNR